MRLVTQEDLSHLLVAPDCHWFFTVGSLVAVRFGNRWDCKDAASLKATYTEMRAESFKSSDVVVEITVTDV